MVSSSAEVNVIRSNEPDVHNKKYKENARERIGKAVILKQ